MSEELFVFNIRSRISGHNMCLSLWSFLPAADLTCSEPINGRKRLIKNHYLHAQTPSKNETTES